MRLEEIITRLKAHEAELRASGVMGMSVFGSLARRDHTAASDIDLAATFDPAARFSLLDHVRLERRLRSWLDADVDLVKEPVRMKPRLQAEIDRDRVVAF